jgi:hypothetical protein
MFRERRDDGLKNTRHRQADSAALGGRVQRIQMNRLVPCPPSILLRTNNLSRQRNQ